MGVDCGGGLGVEECVEQIRTLFGNMVIECRWEEVNERISQISQWNT